MKNKKILIIEDEKDIVRLLTHYLEKEGYSVESVADGMVGFEMARREAPALIILDLMLPELDGLEVCKKLRRTEETATLPILMLTAKGGEADKIVGLELGADDYVTKPFSPNEVMARVKALLRRSERPGEEHGAYACGPVKLDMPRHVVTVDGREVRLTAKEFDLLLRLMKNPGRVLTRDSLLDTVWGYCSDVTTRTVDVHIRRLREKIPYLVRAIVTVPSHGYKLVEKDEG